MKLLPESVTRGIGHNILIAKKNSPHIFFAGGIVGVVTSTVLACKATLQLEKMVDEVKEDLSSVKEMNNNVVTVDGEKRPEQEYYKDLMCVYSKSAMKIGRLYGPSIAIGVVSITALTGSHVQLTRRNTALTVTLAAVSKAFDEYRIRVQEEIGKERELELHRAIREETIEGEKKPIKVTDPNGWSPYARMFDEVNVNWTKSPEYNRIFIQCQQNYMNDLLRARGHVFLNDVYDALGMERSSAGAVVGWVINGNGDNFVDFGLFEATSSKFINNMERSIILDFNVDGVIYDKI